MCGAGEGDEKPWDGLVCSCSDLDAGGVNGLVLRVAGHDYEMVPLNVFFHLLGKNIAATLMLEALEVKSEERLHLMRPAISVCTRCTQRMR